MEEEGAVMAAVTVTLLMEVTLVVVVIVLCWSQPIHSDALGEECPRHSLWPVLLRGAPGNASPFDNNNVAGSALWF